MNRFDELIIQLEKNYPDDLWLKAYNSDGGQDELFTRKFDIYRSSLSELDSKSWKIFKSKLTLAFKQSIPKRGKTPFFDLLNESLAYQYLKKSGFDNVRFIKESKVKTPDLSFQSNENKQYCEVKTINVSDKQVNLYYDSVQTSSLDCTRPTDQFFKKLESTINSACSKFQPLSKKNIVYIIVQLDDFACLFPQNCKNSIKKFLKSKFEKQTIFLRFSIFGNDFINHNGY